MRRWLRPLWIFLALLFLLEAWLWDHLEPLVAWFVGLIAWDKLKVRLAKLIESLPPWATLIVFVIPFFILLPVKFLEVWLLATGQWLAAIGVLLLVKLAGLGITAFIFDATRGKLMQMAWFRALYDWVMALREWALAQTKPIRNRMRKLMWLLKPQRAGRFLRRLMWIRRRAYRRAA